MVDSVWKINDENLIVYDSSRWTVESFVISHSKQCSISLQGSVANNTNDKLGITLHNFNLASLNLGSTELEGMLNGTAFITDLFNHPFFTSAINFSGLNYNKEFIGDGKINASWDTLSNSISVDAGFLQHGIPILSAKGKYAPGISQNNLNIDAQFTGFPTKLFQPYLKDVCSILDGSITGYAHITGEPARPLISGSVVAPVTRIKFDYLNTSYHSPGIKVAIVTDSFKVIPSLLLDEKGDTAIFTGDFTHHNFKDLQMNFHLHAKNFLCLNTTENNNNSYFGTAFVTGDIQIYGLLDALNIYADVTTDKNTKFNIPLSNSSDVDQGSYIQFTSKGKNKRQKTAYKVNTNGLQLDFTVHVTPDATSSILFSSRGEVLQSLGYGTIQFQMDNIGDINMRGNYFVIGGSYNFVLQNIINRRFVLQPGGTIVWNGDPYNADINLTTVYTPGGGVSLAPFFPGDASGVYSRHYPVDCDLDLSGKLTSPDIAFKIELPDVDDQTREVVESYLSNTDELTTQVFSLLIINSFMPVGSGLGGNGFGNQLGIANSAEILSSQLTNMFNNINKNFNIGLDIQPGTTINPAEYKLALSTALFNGRVTVNTDVGTQSGIATTTQSANSSFVGEVNVEYSLIKSGKLRLKAFNKANDNTTLYALNAPYTQGVGLSYKAGFNSWKELWQKMVGKKPKVVKTTGSTQ
jgi:hypothetical protein